MVLIAASPDNIIEGETSQLNAEGLLDYTWSPVATLSSSTIANPVAQPLATTEYTVTGKDNNNCTGTGTIVVTVKGESIVTKLTPKNFFSPNGDGHGNSDYWIVDKITEYPQCGVTVYDDKGIKVFEAKPYNNDWDGENLNGKRLPEGVYFYVIRCDGEESVPKSGSITLLR
jgi:gliding motility-associated-like protein